MKQKKVNSESLPKEAKTSKKMKKSKSIPKQVIPPKNVKRKQKIEMDPVNKAQRNSIYSVVYMFLGLFVFTVGYFIYFIVFQSGHIINSTYNRRHDILAEHVIKGSIYAADGSVLAETLIDEEGKEYRNYTYGPTFAHVVGRDKKGRTGLEETENITLLTSSMNSIENMYNDLKGSKSIGDNVITTLRVDLQKVAYEALGDNRGAVVILEPSTGKVLAMVSKPAYDPMTINELWDELVSDENKESVLINRVTQGLYPPGSTFKLVTALAYMRENSDYNSFQYKCNGETQYNGMVIRCYNHTAHGNVNLMNAMAKSCNTTFATIGQSLNIAAFREVSESLLFNQSLPLTMSSSVSRFELEVGQSGVKEQMQTAIGQGKTLMTPMLNAMITATIANGGTMMKPYIVDQVINGDGAIVKQYYPTIYKEPISTSEAAYLTGLMNEVVQRGTGSKLADLKVNVAGKTGSADTEGNKAHAWFVGFAPVEVPKIAICVIVENKGTGSDYAVPIAQKVFQTFFNN